MSNYFELFELPEKYEIDLADLKKNYLNLQAKYHPDQARHEAEKVEFINRSMELNSGYKLLMDSYSRAEYLLALKGYFIRDEDSKHLLSADDLERIWERNEELEEAKSLEELYALEKEAVIDQNALELKLAASFAALEYEKALEIAVKLKYLANLVKNIRLKIKDANS